MRSMVFVDGENFTLGVQRLAEQYKLRLDEGPCYMADVFAWFPDYDPRTWSVQAGFHERATRAYYYTSVVGDEQKVTLVRRNLRELGFDPQVFKRDSRQTKAKGVDISLTKDVLAGAFRNNYDAALLFAGDGDYVPLIEEVKHLGKLVCGACFSGDGLGLNPEIRLACDHFISLDEGFASAWSRKFK